MRPNYKFHAIALTVICVAITVLFFLFQPKEQPLVDDTLRGNRFIEVYSATWGQECNPFIEQQMETRRKAPPTKDEKGEVIKMEPLTLVETNNVIAGISSLCNGKLTCAINPTSDSLGIEPLPSCFKKLVVEYRCFSFDRLRRASIDQATNSTIDCNDNEAATPTPATPQQ